MFGGDICLGIPSTLIVVSLFFDVPAPMLGASNESLLLGAFDCLSFYLFEVLSIERLFSLKILLALRF